MSAKKLVIDPNWHKAGRLLSVRDLIAITGYGYDSILSLVRSGTIRPSLPRKPFMFDPAHIFEVFFQSSPDRGHDAPSSLKTEKKDSVGHKPVKREDLWQD